MLNSFGLLFVIIVIMAILTYIIPAGEYERSICCDWPGGRNCGQTWP